MCSQKSLKSLKRPRETPENEVNGYLHDVTPVKLSRNNKRYFNATLQTDRERYIDLVCFDAGRHVTMKSAADKLTPLKLEEIREVPSHNKTASTDVIVNHRSIVSVTRQLNFQPKVPTKSGEEPIEIQQLKNIPAFNKVTVIGKVIVLQDRTTQMVREELLKKRMATLADATSTIQLTMWGRHVDEVVEGGTYKFQHVATRDFQQKSITTTKATEITESAAIKETCAVDADEPSTSGQSIEGKVLQVSVEADYHCSACNKHFTTDPASHLTFVRCDNCHMRQFKTSLCKKLKAKLFIQSEDGHSAKLTAFTAVLSQFINNNVIPDPEDVEERILTAASVKVDYTAENVVTSLILL